MINSLAKSRNLRRNAVLSVLFPVLVLALFLPLQSRDTRAQGAPKPLLPSLGAPKPLLPPAAGSPGETNDDTGTIEAAPDLLPADNDARKPKAGIAVNALTLSRKRVSGPSGAETPHCQPQCGTIPKRYPADAGPGWRGTGNRFFAESDARVRGPCRSAAADPANRTNIVKARIDALERLGAWQGYLRLLEIAPTGGDETDLSPAVRARLSTDAGFLTGDIESSCAIARDGMLSFLKIATGRRQEPLSGACGRVGKRRVQSPSDAGTWRSGYPLSGVDVCRQRHDVGPFPDARASPTQTAGYRHDAGSRDRPRHV